MNNLVELRILSDLSNKVCAIMNLGLTKLVKLIELLWLRSILDPLVKNSHTNLAEWREKTLILCQLHLLEPLSKSETMPKPTKA